MKKEIEITGIVEAIPELKYTCESCETTFWIGENLIDYKMGIISPCKCYHCVNDEADEKMKIHNNSLEEFDEADEFKDIA
jgi:hypothetical protein